MQSDDVVWQIINTKYCAYKIKTDNQTFCKNEYNLTGLCSKNACPLANSVYATVIEKKGKLYLCTKTIERYFTPNKLWTHTKLPENYGEALKLIETTLMYANKFQIHKCKQRLTKLTEMLKRMRKLKLKSKTKFTVIKQKAERRDQIRLEKAEQRAQIGNVIEKELMDRLKLGTYSEMYDDLLNLNKTAFEKHLEKQDILEDEDLEEIDFEDVDIEDNLEFVFENGIGEIEEEAMELEEGLQKEIRVKRKKKSLIKKKKIELLLEDDEEMEEELVN